MLHWLRLELLIGMTWFAESWSLAGEFVKGVLFREFSKECFDEKTGRPSVGCIFCPSVNRTSAPTFQLKIKNICCVLFVIKKYCFQLAFWAILLLWLYSVGMLTNASQQTCKLPAINKSIISKVKQRVRYYWEEAASCCWPGTNNRIEFCWEESFKS